MTDIQLPRLATPQDTFTSLRASSAVLVDKTALLPQLIDENKVYLACPNGMGKTMLLTMLSELFTDGTEQFEGLAVYEHWSLTESYPVIFISLDELDCAPTLELELILRLRYAWKQAGFPQALNVAPRAFTLSALLPALNSLAGQQEIVVLIDDWDYSFTNTAQSPQDLATIERLLSTLFSWVQQCSQARFVMVTGLDRPSKVPMVGFDQFHDISTDPRFATLLGITYEELEANYGPYLKHQARRLNQTCDQFVRTLQACIHTVRTDDGAKHRLYVPSELNFLLRALTGLAPNPLISAFAATIGLR